MRNASGQKGEMSNNVKKANRNAYGISNTNPVGGKFLEVLRHFPHIDEKPNCIQSSFEKKKKKLDSSYISFCGGSTCKNTTVGYSYALTLYQTNFRSD